VVERPHERRRVEEVDSGDAQTFLGHESV
jgi:hypothetical protein